ncbi:MAG: hypothetical protein DMF77_24725 [Acidobacteria bacterium]|nr:MAG: hypothetical protein DMF77_24725 [Acidobacteriota bacterium]
MVTESPGRPLTLAPAVAAPVTPSITDTEAEGAVLAPPPPHPARGSRGRRRTRRIGPRMSIIQ